MFKMLTQTFSFFHLDIPLTILNFLWPILIIVTLQLWPKMHLFLVYKKTLSWHKALLNLSWINCSFKEYTIFMLPALEAATRMSCFYCALKQYALTCVKILGQTTFRFSHFRYPTCHFELFTTNINHCIFATVTKNAFIPSLQENFVLTQSST
jgi:hypothetical protein